MGLLNFSSDQSFYTNSASREKKKRYCVALLMPFFRWNGHLNKTKFKLNEKRGVGRDGRGGGGGGTQRSSQPLISRCKFVLLRWHVTRYEAETLNNNRIKGAFAALYDAPYACVCMHARSVHVGLPSCDRVLYSFSSSNGPQLAFAHWSQAASPT